ncbi:MAG: hypothetical protein K9J30_10550 [Bacteroidales bacterium]|nr:hypothetical protein [Bacteroidales bacterium]
MLLKKIDSLIVYLFIFIHSIPLSGQEYSNIPAPDSSRLKLYMDCRDCDFSFFRRNLPYVDFVRDQKSSDLHLLVTEQRTASDGRAYGLNFIGSGAFKDLHYKLVTISPQSDTELQTWNRLLKTTRAGLMPFITRTDDIEKLDISYFNDSTIADPDQKNFDNWNYWVFRVAAGSDFETEESKDEFSIRGRFDLDRITEKLKFRADISYYRNIERFNDNSEIIESLREEIDSDAEAVFSLSPHWSAGIFNEIRTSTYQNIDLSHRLGPAIEYNIFPWDKSDRKIFSLGYHIQYHYYDYMDLTVYDELQELRLSESLRLTFILREPWGEVETRIEGAHYFHDLSKNSLTIDSELSVNVTKGLSFYVEVNAGLIHDQLYLPAGEVTLEELLLRQRQLQSDYEFSAEFGISYTFGSIYNNIVNQRF